MQEAHDIFGDAGDLLAVYEARRRAAGMDSGARNEMFGDEEGAELGEEMEGFDEEKVNVHHSLSTLTK